MLDHERRVQIKETIEGLIDDLSDHDDASATGDANGQTATDVPSPVMPQDQLEPAWREWAAICVAGHGSLDEAAAAMLAQLLQKHGIGARVVPSHAVSAANIFRFDPADAAIVCLSYLEPGGLMSARYLARRLRRKLPRAKILLGLWTLNQADSERRDAIQETGVDVVVTSLREAVERVVAEAREAVGTADGATPPPPTIGAVSATG